MRKDETVTYTPYTTKRWEVTGCTPRWDNGKHAPATGRTVTIRIPDDEEWGLASADRALVEAAPRLFELLTNLTDLAQFRGGHLDEYKAAVTEAREVLASIA